MAKANTKVKSFVIDASAIYNGVLSHKLSGKKYLPQCVTYEIEGMYRGEALLEEISVKKDVIITIPKTESIKAIDENAKKTGDITELSECDIKVIALAYELQLQGQLVEIITDDYDIQNLANYMNIPYKGIYWKGITWIHEYTWVCTGCGFRTKEKMETCYDCGSLMKKKVQKKKKRR